MIAIKQMLDHVRCKQLLLCAYQPTGAEDATAITLTDITSLLRIDSADCIALVRRLQLKGFVEPPPGGEPGSLQLTVKGQRFVERMAVRVGESCTLHSGADQASPTLS